MYLLQSRSSGSFCYRRQILDSTRTIHGTIFGVRWAKKSHIRLAEWKPKSTPSVISRSFPKLTQQEALRMDAQMVGGHPSPDCQGASKRMCIGRSNILSYLVAKRGVDQTTRNSFRVSRGCTTHGWRRQSCPGDADEKACKLRNLSVWICNDYLNDCSHAQSTPWMGYGIYHLDEASTRVSRT